MASVDSAVRGLRLLSWAAALMIVRFLIDPVVVALSIGDADLADLGRTVAWCARLHVLDLVVVALIGAGVLASWGELGRRRLSRTPATVALIGVGIALVVNVWMYLVIDELATRLIAVRPLFADDLGDLLERVRRLPLWALVGTAAYLGCLFGAVLTVRAFAVADDALPLREQARAIGGMVVLLFLADTGYRFTYGLGSTAGPLGALSLLGALAIALFWLWCHRRLGRLWESAGYHLRTTATLPIAQVVERPRPTVPRAQVEPPRPEPVTTQAPEVSAETPLTDGPRRLR